MGSETQRALLTSDPVRVLMEEFETAYSSFGRAPCSWGFKIFPSHLRNHTFMSWLWSNMESAIILQRKNGQLADCAYP